MITAEEKAIDIISKMYNNPYVQDDEAKRCAIVLVNERLAELEEDFLKHTNISIIYKHLSSKQKYWKNVREKINNINVR